MIILSGFSLLKSLVMTSGELEYEEVFRFVGFHDVGSRGLNDTMATDTFLSSGGLNYFNMSTILWVVLVIVMPVLFANLLVSNILLIIIAQQLCVATYYVHIYFVVNHDQHVLCMCIDWSCCW